MARLTDEHIGYIIKDLNYRGIVAEGIGEELIDHICVSVEEEMEKGMRFIDAYHKALHRFGHNKGLRDIQSQVLRSDNKPATLMLKNYFIIAYRHLQKQGFYSLINISGLAIGIAACLIIVLFILDEFQYDNYNSKADRIYRMSAEVKFGGNHFFMTYRGAPEANALQHEYPEVESVVRFRMIGPYLVKPAGGAENIKEKNVVWTDSTFFKIFSVPVLEGNPDKALAEPGSIAVSRKIAEKYFPGQSALGQSLVLDNRYTARITAVYENIPAASHFHFDILVAMVGDWPIAREARSESYLSENFNEYILLKEGTDAKAFEKKFPGFLRKYVGPQLAQAFGKDFTMEKFKATGNQYDMFLTPLKDIHLQSDMRGEFEANGNITYVYLLGIISFFILAIACINFMNLSTARSSNRAKEVGVRKVMGSLRGHLVRQFLAESILVTLLSFIAAMGIAYLFLPLFNNLSLKQLSIPFSDPRFYGILVVACVVIGIMAGLYPSFFLSAFKPVSVLKGNVSRGMKSGFIRSVLVVFQFGVSIFLIIGALAVNRQLHYIQNKKLGFEKDQVILIHNAYALRPNNVTPFRNEVMKQSAVEDGTITGFVPVDNEDSWRSNTTFWKEGSQPAAENMVSMQRWSIDVDYVNTFRMKVVEGRNFSPAFPSDSSGIILNQAAVRQFGFAGDPIGQRVASFKGNGSSDDPLSPENSRTFTVIGVVENFHFTSMKDNIQALGFTLDKSDGMVSFRFKPAKANEVIASMERIWKQLAPGYPFEYSFLDQDFDRMYTSEQRLGNIFTVFASLAVIIACFGLFALTSFTAEQRTKEIGIRKVLGASVSSIVLLLSREFGKLIVIAFVLAVPAAWMSINWWLDNYSYKTEIGIVVYLLAGIASFIIAWLTMSYQSFRAATNDPVKSLRSE